MFVFTECFYRPQTKVMFLQLSVILFSGGGYTTPWSRPRHTPPGHPSPPAHTHTHPDTPRHPPWTPPLRSTSGSNAFYWNAFLFDKIKPGEQYITIRTLKFHYYHMRPGARIDFFSLLDFLATDVDTCYCSQRKHYTFRLMLQCGRKWQQNKLVPSKDFFVSMLCALGSYRRSPTILRIEQTAAGGRGEREGEIWSIP